MHGIEQIVSTYLDDAFADYAIMIDGTWGSGKTYYWNNVITPLITKRPSARPGKNLRTVYVSLYGLTKPEDIDREILLALHPAFSGKASRLVAGSAGRFAASGIKFASKKFLGFSFDLGTANIKIGDWLKLDNVVLCFDDLERSSIPIKDMMGYINQYVEHKKVKTFVLCFENMISAAQKDEYTKIKEKLVGRTIRFRVDHAEVVASLIGMLSKDTAYHNFLSQHNEQIVRIFEKSGTDNVRILMHGLSALHAVFVPLNSRFPQMPELTERFISLVLSLTFEFGSGRAFEEQVLDIASQERTMFHTALLTKEGEISYVDQYFQRYFGGNLGRGVTSTAIGNFITSGQLDEGHLLEELKWLTEAKSDLDTAIGMLFNQDFFDRQSELDDSQFQKSSRTVLDGAKNGAIGSFPLLYKLFGNAMGWASLGLVLESADDIKKLMNTAVDKAVENGGLTFHDDLEDALHFFDVEGMPELRTFRDHLLEVNRALEQEEIKKEGLSLLADLRNQPDVAITKLYNEWKDSPVLVTLSAHELAEAIVNMPNSVKLSFKYVMENRYRHGVDTYRQEVNLLISLKGLLNEWVKKHQERPRGRSVVLVEKIVNQLQIVLNQRGTPTPSAKQPPARP